MTTFQPDDAARTREIVTWAASEAQTLNIMSGGSKRLLGRPSEAAHSLDLSRLAGIMDYDSAELVLTAHAATSMAEIQRRLSEQHQMLAFEPPDWRGLLGGGGEPTLAGTLACNVSGPRRVRAGAARDHFLGFAAINGRGDAWKAGGRVVKNVTGYDMCKLQAGAYGTLSVLTEISIRVVPRPEDSATLLLGGLSDEYGVVALSRALNTPHEVSAAAHLPAAIAARSEILHKAGFASSVTAFRLEGPAPSVSFRAAALEAGLHGCIRLDHAQTVHFWTDVGTVSPLLDLHGRCVWRVCSVPSTAPDVLRAVHRRYGSAEGYYDWGGGLLWISLDAEAARTDAGASAVRAAVRTAGGHATLMVAPDPLRAAIAVFEPEQRTLAALSRRVKDSFDPHGILNPGRVREGQ